MDGFLGKRGMIGFESLIYALATHKNGNDKGE